MILITGGAGYIGSHLLLELIDQDEVVVIDDLSTGYFGSLPKNVSFEHVNILDKSALLKVMANYKPSSVYHLAGAIDAAESVDNPMKYFQINTQGTNNLLQAARKFGIHRLSFASTAAVYGNGSTDKYVEDGPCIPVNPYGLSKLLAEKNIVKFAQNNFKYSIFRFFNVVGADQELRAGKRNKLGTLFSNCLDVVAKKREQLSIFGDKLPTPDGTSIRDYIHVSDLVSAMVSSNERLDEKNENQVLNIGYGMGYSVLEVVKVFEQVTSQKFKLNMASPRQEAAVSIANIDQLKKLINWQPNFSDLKSMISTSWEWQKKVYLMDSNA